MSRAPGSAAPVPGPWGDGAGRCALLLAALLLVTFPGVFLGQTSFFYRDYGVLAYPTVAFHRAVFWEGELPHWNPLSHCGVPFLAQWGTMSLYPGSLIYLLLPLPWSLGLFCLAHLWLGGWGMYRLTRDWTRHEPASGWAGVAFLFSGAVMSCLIWPNYTVALGWMPWVVLSAKRAAQEGGRQLAWAAGAACLQLLAGAPELVGLTWMVVAAVAATDRAAGVAAPWRGRAARLGFVLVLALGLSAAQLLPFFNLLGGSQRDGSTPNPLWALPAWGLANLLVPLVHTYQTTQGVHFQLGQEFLSSVYLGAGVLSAVLFGAVSVQETRYRVLLALLGLSLWLALGDGGGLYRWARAALPPLGWMRYPVKFVLLTAFLAPLLAGRALAQLQAEGDRGRLASPVAPSSGSGWAQGIAGPWGGPRLGWFTAVAVVLAGLGGVTWWACGRPFPTDLPRLTAWNAAARAAFLVATGAAVWMLVQARRPPMVSLALAGLVIVTWADFRLHVPRQNPTLPVVFLAPGAGPARAHPAWGDGRVLITPSAEAALLNSRVASFEADYVGKRLALWSNLNLVEGVPKVNGASTLRLRAQAEVEQWLYGREPTPGWFLDFLGVCQVSSPSNPVEWVNRDSALPLVTVGRTPIYGTGCEPLSGLTNVAFDPRESVLLPEAARGDLETLARESSNRSSGVVEGPRISGVKHGRETVEAEVWADAPAWLVVAQSYAPGWHAWVNDRPVKLWPANHAFQALAVPVGHSRVRLEYQDCWFRVGLGISCAAVLVWLARISWARAGSMGC